MHMGYDVMQTVITCVFTMLKIYLVIIYVSGSLDVLDALLVHVDRLSPGNGMHVGIKSC